MSNDPKKAAEDKEAKTFVEGIDYYFEDGLMVLTRKYLLDRGFCCDSGCRHCPYRENEPA
jgi:hypothetical protein